MEDSNLITRCTVMERVNVKVGANPAWEKPVRRILAMLEAGDAPYGGPVCGHKVGRTEDQRRGLVHEVDPTGSAAVSATERAAEGYAPHTLEGRCIRQVSKARAAVTGGGLLDAGTDVERIVSYLMRTAPEFLRHEERISWIDPRTGVYEVETTVAEDLWAPPGQKPKRHRAASKLSELQKDRIQDAYHAVCEGFEARQAVAYTMEAYRITAEMYGVSDETVRKLIKNR